jgi:hypothetical protein
VGVVLFTTTEVLGMKRLLFTFNTPLGSATTNLSLESLLVFALISLILTFPAAMSTDSVGCAVCMPICEKSIPDENINNRFKIVFLIVFFLKNLFQIQTYIILDKMNNRTYIRYTTNVHHGMNVIDYQLCLDVFFLEKTVFDINANTVR